MTWITVKEAAGIVGYTERAIRKKATDGDYKYRYVKSPVGQGGRKMEIALESLPEAAQIAYKNQNGDINYVPNEPHYSTKAQKEKGMLRAEAITSYKSFLREKKKQGIKSKCDIMDLFILEWNDAHADFPITRKKLYDWMKKSKSGQVEKLVDRRGGHNRGQSTIPEECVKYFDSLYLQQTKPTLTSCYDETRIFAKAHGYFCPGIKAFRNHIESIPEVVLIRYREGKKAFDDKCMPYAERDYTQLEPNQLWVSDHHLCDVFVKVPNSKGGWKLERPWGSYWMDMRTRKIVSSILRIESPNADIVLASFAKGVEEYGIPQGVYLDNGKDYKAGDLFYSEKDREQLTGNIAANLQITPHYAIPYNAKAKPIERLFNTFEEEFGKKFPSYAGRDAKQRPEDLKDIDFDNVVTLEEFIEFHDTYIYSIYNESPHTGNGMNGKSPNRVYKDELFTIRRATKEMLYFCLMRIKGTRIVRKDGITYNGANYRSDDCINHYGKKVIAKYNPAKPELLYIFDPNENFLFFAEKVEKYGWNLTDEDYEALNRTKKEAKQVLNGYKPNSEIRTPEAIKERLALMADAMPKAEKPEPKVIEIVSNENMEKAIADMHKTDIDRAYDNMLEKQAIRKKAISDKQKGYADIFKNKFLTRERETRKQA